MQIIGSPYSHLLKPMRIATNKQQQEKHIYENHLKPMRIAAIITHKTACAAISMGFKGFHLFLVVFAWVFKWYPLKPMQIIGSPYSHLLKPMRIATNRQLESNLLMKIT